MKRNNALDEHTHLTFFGGWGKDDVAALARLGTIVEIEPGELVSTNTSAAREFVLLLHGSAVIDGGPRHGQTLEPGDHLGEVAMLSEPTPPAALVATSYTLVFAMSSQEFRSVIASVPSFGRRLATDLARYTRLAMA